MIDLEFFVQNGVMHPDVCLSTSLAVGFPVSVYQLLWPIKGYQIMTWNESRGFWSDFWEYHLTHAKQFYPTPQKAADAFIRAWDVWQSQGRAGTWIYFIECMVTEFIKIGFARDPQDRLATLQTGCPTQLALLAVMPGTRQTERWLHSKFSYCRERGEWFRPDRLLLDFIKQQKRRV